MKEVASKQPAESSRGRAGFPLVVYGSSALGNLYVALPDEQKRSIVEAWLSGGSEPVVIDSAGKYGAGLALECLGDCLRALQVPPEEVAIGIKLGWYRVPLVGDEPTFEPGAWVGLEHDAEQRISGRGVLDCWRQGCELLGEPYAPRMASVHDPDEYLAAADDDADRSERSRGLDEAYAELAALRDRTPGMTVGVGVKDWRVARQITEKASLDWVMLANCVTAYTHEPGVLEFIENLASQGVPVVNSGVFNAGFLVGGRYFDYRLPSPTEEAELFRWREGFLALCDEHRVAPAHACIQFGLSPPGVVSVALNTTNPERVADNWRHATEALPTSFWEELKSRRLIDDAYPYL